MHASIATVLVAGAALVAAQGSYPSIPQCALGCFAQYIPMTGCSLTDFHCSCTSPKIGSITLQIDQCVVNSCPTVQDQIQTQQAVNGICASNGGPSQVAGVPGVVPSGVTDPQASSALAASSTAMGSASASSGSAMTTSSSGGLGGFGNSGTSSSSMAMMSSTAALGGFGAASSASSSAPAFPSGPRAMSFTSGAEATAAPVANGAQLVFAAAAAAGAFAF